MKDVADALVPDVPERRRVARDAFADAILTHASGALGAKANAAFADPEAQTVSSAQIMMMASAAGNIAIATEDFVVE